MDEFNPSLGECGSCQGKVLDPTSYGGRVCVYVGFPGHPGKCNETGGVRVVAEMPVERITVETPIDAWATSLLRTR